MSRNHHVFFALLCLAIPSGTQAGVKGDLNDDGRVDAADAQLLTRVVRGDLDPATLSPAAVADIYPILSATACGDGDETQHDLLLMLRALKGEDVDSDTLDRDGETAAGTSPFLADTDADGHLDPSDPAPLTPTPPFTPGTRRVFDSPTDVQLTWTAGSSVDYYVIHRYGTDGSYEYFIADGADLSFTDDDAQSGVVYRYWIQGVNGLGQEAGFVDCDVTDPANDTLWLTGSLGDHPNPHFTAQVNGSDVDFAWEESPDTSVTGYKIWIVSNPSSGQHPKLGQDAGDFAEADTIVGRSTTSHTLSNLPTGTHYFRMTATGLTTTSNLDAARQVVVQVN